MLFIRFFVEPKIGNLRYIIKEIKRMNRFRRIVESREKYITSSTESMRGLNERELSAYTRLLTEFQNKYVHEIPEAEIMLSLVNRSTFFVSLGIQIISN